MPKKKSLKEYQFRTDAALDDQIKKIKVFKALNDETVDGNDLLEKSGLEILVNKLLKSLGPLCNSVKSGFMEISTIASTMHRNQLDSFNVNLVDMQLHNDIEDQFNKNVTDYFVNIIDLLRSNNLVLFNHPGFLIHPAEILNFISVITHTGKLKLDKPYQYKKEIDVCYKDLKPQVRMDKYISPDNGKLRQYKLKVRKSSIKNLTYDEVALEVPGKVEKKLKELLVLPETATCEGPELFGLHYLNHKLYHHFFQEKFSENNSSLFVSIPILDPDPQNDDQYLGIGAVFILLLLDKDADCNLFSEKVKKYCNDIPRIIRSYLPGYITTIATEKLEEVKKYAIKAAETKILSRNFSHHIGSHVMPNVSLKLIRMRYQELCGKAIDDELLDILKSRLDKYITERNEFLCYSDSPFLSVLFYSQAIVPFVENVLLLDNLCRSEGLGFRKGQGCDIRIHVRADGQEVTSSFGPHAYPACLPYNGVYDEVRKMSVTAETTGKDLPVVLPNVHVIFSILENFIRNTAKHQKSKFARNGTAKDSVTNLDIYIDLKTIDAFAYEMTIGDNVTKVPATFANKQSINIITKNNTLAEQDLGIIDFKICAGLLNNTGFENVDEQIFKILVEDGRLSYRFKILKPKDVCFIGYEKPLTGAQNSSADIYRNIEEFLSAGETTVPYQFYVVTEREMEVIIREKKIFLLPFRTLVERSNSKKRGQKYYQPKAFGRRFLLVSEIAPLLAGDRLLENLWIKWLNRWDINEDHKMELIVYSEEQLDNWQSRELPVGSMKYGYGKSTDGRPGNIPNKKNNLYPKVFYSHHGGGVTWKTFPPDERSFISGNAFIPFGKNSKDLPLIRNAHSGYNSLLPYWLMEAGLSQVLIIDERITDIASEIYEHEDTRKTLEAFGKLAYSDNNASYRLHNIDAFWAANITVATHLNQVEIRPGSSTGERHHVKLDISAKEVKTEVDFGYLSSEKYERKDVTAHQLKSRKYDAVILHRTFLNKESRDQYWGRLTEAEICTGILNKHFPLVFIASGGGPMNAMEENADLKFISINEMLQCLSVPENIGKQAFINNIYTKIKKPGNA